MNVEARIGTAVAALLGLLAVAAGAFGAHAAPDPATRELLRTGAQYQGLHALAAVVCFAALAAVRGSRIAGWLFVAGACLFGGSLDLLAAGAPRVVGAITPLGGLCLMAGWLWLALGALRSR